MRRNEGWLDARLTAILLAAGIAVACGKKGPPLPPLLKLPAAPDNFTAVRRGDTVALDFTVPNTNTDRTRPANVQRVEIYAFTGPAPPTDTELLKRASKVASVVVKAPRDPDQTTDADQPPEEAEPIEAPEGPGLDQGAAVHLEDRLDREAFVPSADPDQGKKKTTARAGSLPPSAPAPLVPSRTYIGVGINKSGRRGATSKRVAVPLLPPPAPPTSVVATFDERAVTIAWQPPEALQRVDTATAVQKVPSGEAPEGAANTAGAPEATLYDATLAYNVYEVIQATGQSAPEIKLTMTPIAETTFSDPRMAWGATRCYGVRTVRTVGDLAAESDEPPPACVTLKDSFPPAAPQGFTGIATQGAVSLIWEPNNEADLDGYVVLRGLPPGDRLAPVAPGIIRETTFRDIVPSGARYVYAVQAVDKSGNVSRSSMTVEETAR
jgi:hypothetical protein